MFGRTWWGWIRLALVPLALAGLVGLLVLTVVSHRVAARFEARERESPTRIYGRIITLREGDAASRSWVTGALKRLGYRQTRGEPALPGEYRLGGGMTLYTRSFEAPGGLVPARLVRLRFSGGDDGQIESIQDESTGDTFEQIQLEPEVLTSLYGDIQEDRKALQVSEFPQGLVDAVLICEDKRFYGHYGIDPVGVLRATAANMTNGEIRQGGSTLTQQLAKNLFFDQKRTWTRKAQEAVVALMLERRYSKERILQAYMNEAYLGQSGSVSIRGFAQAASFYFGKDVAFLDLSESATLAGLIRAPGVYNPFVHPDRAKERRDQVLGIMEAAGTITADERKAAERLPLRLRKDRETRSTSRGILYLADYVRQMIGPDAGDLSRAGLRVYTTVDPMLQRRAEEALTRGLASLEKNYPVLRRKAAAGQKIQGAMVVLDRRDGSVLAMVGGRDYATSQFNRITQAHRQPGSLFKPFVYLAGYEAAREGGWGSTPFTPGTPLEDEPLSMTVAGKEWAPANYDGEFRGEVTAQYALEESLNVPTVRAALDIGLPAVAAMAKAAGIESALRPFPSLALGAQEVTPLEMASAYATIANGGMRSDPGLVESIEEVGGRQVFQRKRNTRRVLSPQSAYLITVALQGALDRGTGASSRALGFTGTAAGKTGTTDDYRDAWFAGYTPDLVALTWVGFDDSTPTHLTGAQAALPIWVDFMQGVGEPRETFDEPDGIVWEQIDPSSGFLSRWSCPESRYVAFLEGTEPVDKCTRHGFFARWERESGVYQ